jgi:hypothetical protein
MHRRKMCQVWPLKQQCKFTGAELYLRRRKSNLGMSPLSRPVRCTTNIEKSGKAEVNVMQSGCRPECFGSMV